MLEARGEPFEIVRYLDDPPSVEVLRDLVRRVGVEPLAIVRTKDPIFRSLGLSRSDRRAAGEWLRIVADNPRLLERPIVVHGDRAVVGRPPEAILDLFDSGA